jgi:hypothetical protein
VIFAEGSGLLMMTEEKMTVRIEPPGLADWVLGLFGKRRALILPRAERPFGDYLARRESFLSALLRPVSRPLPPGCIYPGELEGGKDGV